MRALAQSVPWESGGGGKSGSLFCKTLDDRFLIKQVHRSEFWSLHEHCRAYFNFVSQTPAVLPSVLARGRGRGRGRVMARVRVRVRVRVRMGVHHGVGEDEDEQGADAHHLEGAPG